MSDWLTALSIVAPVATALGGYALAGANEEKRDRRQAAREKEARDAERTGRLQDRNQDFQREVLLGLQDPLGRMGRAAFLAIQRDLQTVESNGQMYQLPENLNQEVYDSGVVFLEAMNRVTDDGLRHHLRELYNFANGGIDVEVLRLQNSPPDAVAADLKAARSKLSTLMVKASDELGNVLRRGLSREG